MIPYAHRFVVVVKDTQGKILFALPVHDRLKAFSTTFYHVDNARTMLGGETVTFRDNETGEEFTAQAR